jgi:trigger factor
MSNITIEKKSEAAASRSRQVTVGVERVKQAEDKAVAMYASRARLPGFRPGKAPVAIVRKKFDQAIKQAVLEDVIRESWEEAQSTQGLKPIADPSVRNLKFEAGGPVEFELVVEVRPEITLARTGGFSFTRTVPKVDDAAITEQLDRMRERKANWNPVEGGKPAPGHMVRIEVAPIDGDKVGESNPHNIVLGQNQAVPDLEEKIMGLTPGETVDADVRFPDDHADEARRGQTRRVRVTLHEIKSQELPPLDDAFANEVGNFDTLAFLKDAIRTDLTRDAERNADAQVRSALINELVAANGVPAPHSLVHRWLHAYAHQFGVPHEHEPGGALEKFEAQFHDIAEAQVRRDLIIGAVVDKEKLQATEAEIDERIGALAAARNVPAGDLYAQLQKSGRLSELEHSITEDKAFTWLLSQSTVVEAKS